MTKQKKASTIHHGQKFDWLLSDFARNQPKSLHFKIENDSRTETINTTMAYEIKTVYISPSLKFEHTTINIII